MTGDFGCLRTLTGLRHLSRCGTQRTDVFGVTRSLASLQEPFLEDTQSTRVAIWHRPHASGELIAVESCRKQHDLLWQPRPLWRGSSPAHLATLFLGDGVEEVQCGGAGWRDPVRAGARVGATQRGDGNHTRAGAMPLRSTGHSRSNGESAASQPVLHADHERCRQIERTDESADASPQPNTGDGRYQQLERTDVFAVALPFRTQVTGGIGSLNALTSQQMLLLFRTLFMGDTSSLSVLASLQKPFLFRAQVTGDISSLSALTILQRLSLFRAQVTSAMTSLQHLNLRSAKVTGAISGLRTLSSLQHLNLRSMKVTGDIGCLRALTVRGYCEQHEPRRRLTPLWQGRSSELLARLSAQQWIPAEARVGATPRVARRGLARLATGTA